MRRAAVLVLACLAALLAGAAPAGAHGGPEGALTHRDTRAELAGVQVAATVANAQEQADGVDGLPPRWCGDERRDDDTADAATPAAPAQFKLVYAYAADRPDRFAGWDDALQADVSLVQRFLSAQTGGAKALRFDMGTRCGPLYADVQVVALPGARSAYADDFDAIAGAVRAALAPAAGPRNVVVLADQLAGGRTEYGLGESVLGTQGDRAADNVHDHGGFTAMLFSRDGDAAPADATGGWWPEGMLHEMAHTLGAVQWSAPHSTEPLGQSLPQYGHCWQGADLMCYVEDAGAAHAMVQDCPRLASAIPETLDCGRDDYFNPAPAPGSYLATHRNLYDAAFLAPCAQVAPACGGGARPAPAPPVNTAAPSIAGTPRRGGVLTALPGRWGNTPTRYAFRWQRLARAGWANVPGATSSAYTIATADLGRALRVQVVAGNQDGSAVAESPATLPVTGGALGRAAAAAGRGTARSRSARTRAKARRPRR